MKTTFFLAVAALVGFVAANPLPQGQLGEAIREIIYTLPGGVVVTRTLVAPTPATSEWATRTVIPDSEA